MADKPVGNKVTVHLLTELLTADLSYCCGCCCCAAQALPGNVPRTAWQWSGQISRQLFDSVPFILRDKPVQGVPCQHCTFVLRYKVLEGQLYTDSSRR